MESGVVLAAWDTREGGAIFSVQFSPDGKRIFAASDAGKLHTWYLDPDSGHQLQAVDISDLKKPIAICPKGKYLASLSASKNSVIMMVWCVTGDQCRLEHVSELKGHKARITAITFSPDGRKVVTASDDRTVRLWELESTQWSQITCRVFHVHSESESFRHICLVMLSQSGELLAVRDKDHDHVVLDAMQYEVTSPPPSNVLSSLGACYHTYHNTNWADFHPNEQVQLVAFCTEGGQIHIVDRKHQHGLRRVLGHHAGAKPSSGDVLAIKFSPDGKHIASGSGDASVRVWAIDHIKEVDGDCVPREPQASDSSSALRVSFRGHQRVLEEDGNTDMDLTGVGFFDGRNNPIIGDWSYVDDDGWVRNRCAVHHGLPKWQSVVYPDLESDDMPGGPGDLDDEYL